MLVGQPEPADVAALVADAVHQADRVGAQLLEVAVLVLAAGYPGHDGSGHLILPGRFAPALRQVSASSSTLSR